MRGVDHGRVRAEAAAARQQLDRPEPVLGAALLDLPRLLGRMDVQRQPLALRVAAERLEPRPGARADGVGRDADAEAVRPQLLERPDVLRDRGLAHPLEPAPCVGRVQDDELDAGLGGPLGEGARLLEAEVVELPDRREPRGAHLPVGRRVERADALRGLVFRLGQHPVPPGPEVTSCGPTAERALEGVAVSVDEALQRAWSRHGRPD